MILHIKPLTPNIISLRHDIVLPTDQEVTSEDESGKKICVKM